MNGATDTKKRILDVAERLFADQGFAGTSLRGIIAEAGVNLAAVHYHFRSKEALLEAVLIRRIGPLNQERLALLDQCGKSPQLEGVLNALFAPTIRMILSGPEGRVFGKLVGRLHSETAEIFSDIAKRHFGPVTQRVKAALRQAVPDVPLEELYWRMHFAVGVMAHTLSCWDQLEILSEGMCKVSDADDVIPRLVDFVSAGVRAPVSRRTRKTKRASKAHSEKR
jgi:AcrR family transcriptional regulator